MNNFGKGNLKVKQVDYTKMVNNYFPLCLETYDVLYENSLLVHKVLESLPGLDNGDVVIIKNESEVWYVSQAYLFVKGAGIFYCEGGDINVSIDALISGSIGRAISYEETMNSIVDQNNVEYADIYGTKNAVLVPGSAKWYWLKDVLVAKSEYDLLAAKFNQIPNYFKVAEVSAQPSSIACDGTLSQTPLTLSNGTHANSNWQYSGTVLVRKPEPGVACTYFHIILQVKENITTPYQQPNETLRYIFPSAITNIDGGYLNATCYTAAAGNTPILCSVGLGLTIFIGIQNLTFVAGDKIIITGLIIK